MSLVCSTKKYFRVKFQLLCTTNFLSLFITYSIYSSLFKTILKYCYRVISIRTDCNFLNLLTYSYEQCMRKLKTQTALLSYVRLMQSYMICCLTCRLYRISLTLFLEYSTKNCNTKRIDYGMLEGIDNSPSNKGSKFKNFSCTFLHSKIASLRYIVAYFTNLVLKTTFNTNRPLSKQ